MKDLLVLMSPDGTFNYDIDKIFKTASILKTELKTPMLILWQFMVLPHIDYCCQL